MPEEELSSIRAEIKKEAMRAVLPLPWVGRWMRFEDEFTALQIASDSRFCLSTVTFQGRPADRFTVAERETMASQGQRRVITYEGVLVVPQLSFEVLEPDVAQIQAHGVVRLEIGTSESDLAPLLLNVRRGDFNFELKVLASHISHVELRPIGPGGPDSMGRRRQVLPFVGLGYQGQSRLDRRVSPSRRRDVQRLKFTPLPLESSPLSETAKATRKVTLQNMHLETEASNLLEPSTGATIRLPQLAQLKGTKSLSSLQSAGTAATGDWREFYKNRAAAVLPPYAREDIEQDGNNHAAEASPAKPQKRIWTRNA